MAVQWPGPGDDDAFCPPPLPSAHPVEESVEQKVIAHRQLFGLPVDPRSVARAIENQRPYGSFMTPEEQAEEEAVDNDLPGQAERILKAAGAEVGHTEWCWMDGRRCVLITAKGDVARFRSMLDEWPEGHRVLLESATFSEDELQALLDRITKERDKLSARGIDLAGAGGGRDHVELHYFAADRAAAEHLLRSRYGSAVKPAWIGPSRLVEEPQPFGSWVSDDAALTVFYPLPHNGEQPGKCTATEFEDKVVVTLTILCPRGPKTLVGGYKPSHAAVRLSRPVGDRTVIDSAHNVSRPRWQPSARRA